MEWGGKPLFSHGSTNSKGVMILINSKLDCKIEKVIADKDGRYIIADILLALNFLQELSKMINQLKELMLKQRK